MKNLVFSGILIACVSMTACGGSGPSAPSSTGKGSTGTAVGGVPGNPNNPSVAPTMANSVDPHGNCTPQFISDYNGLVLNTQLIKNAASDKESDQDVATLNNSCSTFFSHHLPSVTCSAHVTYNGKVMVGPISSSTVKGICDQVKQVATPTAITTPRSTKVSPKRSSPVQSTKNPRGKVPNVTLVSLAGPELNFEVLDPQSFAQTGGGSKKYLQGGKVIPGSEVNGQGVFCKVVETTSPPQGAKFSGQKIQNNPVDDSKMNNVMVLANSPGSGNVSFLCVSGSAAPITVKDLKEVLANVVKVTYKAP